jgi:hypothetical protein
MTLQPVIPYGTKIETIENAETYIAQLPTKEMLITNTVQQLNTVIQRIQQMQEYLNSRPQLFNRVTSDNWMYATETADRTIQDLYQSRMDAQLFRDQFKYLLKMFPAVYCGLKEDTRVIILTAVTDPITLQVPGHNKQVDLGQFGIEFTFKATMTERPVLKVRALQPNPPRREIAEGRITNVHPHVRGGGDICLGDGANAVQNALHEFDFVNAAIVVRSVLNNYNSRSPYYRLEDWLTGSCNSCGSALYDEDAVACTVTNCHTKLCKQCAPKYSCTLCGKVACRGHKDTANAFVVCLTCGKSYCSEHIHAPEHLQCGAKSELASLRAQLETISRMAALRARVSGTTTQETNPRVAELTKKIQELEVLLNGTSAVVVPAIEKKKRGRPRKQKKTEETQPVTVEPTVPVTTTPVPATNTGTVPLEQGPQQTAQTVPPLTIDAIQNEDTTPVVPPIIRPADRPLGGFLDD